MSGTIGPAPLGGASGTHFAPLRNAIAAALLILMASLIGAMQALAQPQTVEISIDNFTFAPAEVTIAVGTVVKWVNRDDIPHTVVEKSLSFRSKALDTDDTFTHQFNDAGEINYFCSLHPHMTGKIIVKAKDS